MIKPLLNAANMCRTCPWFEADIEMNKRYNGVKYADTYIHIFCKHKNLCDHIKSFLKDELAWENLIHASLMTIRSVIVIGRSGIRYD